ncbi:MAG: asparagine synthase C-terminal domain-containing protein [Thermoproteota archaeon]|jgi:asparagine synthase (glutamine-hydrolysing)|nr:asparagine synthase C-terminal domain-containing protein [Thermoproteota archaeon]
MLISVLKKALFTAVAESADIDSSVAVAFSGGLDSTLLAKICKDLGFEVTLLTIGFPHSQDIEFSKEIATKIGLHHHIYTLDEQELYKVLSHVRHIIDCENVSHIENCIAYFHIAKLANRSGFQHVLTANGCDELFCGYNEYRLAYGRGRQYITKLMDEKIINELELMNEIETLTCEMGVKLKKPFLTEKFVSFAKNIDIDQKLTGSNDFIRKRILRETALSIGIPEESAMKPKKAIQYGTMIHKKFKTYTKSHIRR